MNLLIRTGDNLSVFAALILIIVLIWATSWVLLIIYLPDGQTRSSFGDMFGAINALFSGAALAGVIFAIHLQRRELALQRRELEMTRQELSRSAVAQEKSEKALNEQAKLMLLTAKLSAVSSLLDAHKKQVELYQVQGVSLGGKAYQDVSVEFRELRQELLKIVNEVKDTYG